MTIQDPPEVYDCIQNHTEPGKTLWIIHKNKTIQDFAQPHKTKEDNTVIQQYNPLKDLT